MKRYYPPNDDSGEKDSGENPNHKPKHQIPSECLVHPALLVAAGHGVITKEQTEAQDSSLRFLLFFGHPTEESIVAFDISMTDAAFLHKRLGDVLNELN